MEFELDRQRHGISHLSKLNKSPHLLLHNRNETSNLEALGELQVETTIFESRERLPDRQLLLYGDDESPAEIEGLFASPISGLAALIFRLRNLFLPAGDMSI